MSSLFKVGAASLMLIAVAPAANAEKSLRALTGLCRFDSECNTGWYCRQTSSGADSQCFEGKARINEYCNESDNCIDAFSCIQSKCVQPLPNGASCDTTAGTAQDRDCKDGYCKYGYPSNTCAAYKNAGEDCIEKYECNIKVNTCNTDTAGGSKVCVKWVPNGGACTSDTQCGGSNPGVGYNFGSCVNDECTDWGDALADALGAAVGVIVGIYVGVPIIILVCCIVLIYMACCKKNKVVVVQS